MRGQVLDEGTVRSFCERDGLARGGGGRREGVGSARGWRARRREMGNACWLRERAKVYFGNGCPSRSIRRTRAKPFRSHGAMGATLIALCGVGACVSSLFWAVLFVTPPLAGGGWGGVGVGQGTVGFGFATNPQAGQHPGKSVMTYGAGPWNWLPDIANTPAGWQVILPVWMFLAPSLLIAAPLWRRRVLARRRGRSGAACAGCEYSRVGLAAGQACPECGLMPRAT